MTSRGATELVYWDACVIQSYIEKYPNRWPILRDLLRASDDPGQPLRIVTSTWSVAEVAYLGELESIRQLPEAYQAIQDFWNSGVIRFIELHELVAATARDIVRRSHFENWTVKPKDAVHLASALSLGVTEFHTYDGKFAERIRNHYGLRAGEPSTLLVRSGALRAVEGVEQGVLGLANAGSSSAASGSAPLSSSLAATDGTAESAAPASPAQTPHA